MPGSIFAPSTDAVALEFEAAPADPAKVEGAIAGFFSALATKVLGTEPVKKTDPTPPAPANDNAMDFATFATDLGKTVGQSIAAAIAPVMQVWVGIVVSYFMTNAVGAMISLHHFVAQAIGFVFGMIAFKAAPGFITGCSAVLAELPGKLSERLLALIPRKDPK